MARKGTGKMAGKSKFKTSANAVRSGTGGGAATQPTGYATTPRGRQTKAFTPQGQDKGGVASVVPTVKLSPVGKSAYGVQK
jgi:hypothetical protein